MQTTRSATTLLALALFTVAAGCSEPEEDLPKDPNPSPIAQARAMSAGSTAKVEGFVTVVPGTFNSATGEMGFAIQDDTGGIYVSMPEGVTAGFGAEVSVTGKLAQMAQMTVLTAAPDAVTVGVAIKNPAPKDVQTGEVNESIEGQLVRVTGQVTQAVVDDLPYRYKVFVDDGSGEVQVFVHVVANMPIIDTTSITMGSMIEVTGLAGQYEATYEVMPRRIEDLVVK
jgi:DNA/RNA endonuclease YhcR with UshA esterase domain